MRNGLDDISSPRRARFFDGLLCSLSHSLNSPRSSLCAGRRKIEGYVTASDKDGASGAMRALWERAWPLAGLTLALVVNVAWIGALGYAVIWLL